MQQVDTMIAAIAFSLGKLLDRDGRLRSVRGAGLAGRELGDVNRLTA
jgi:hypothetical protein